MHRFDRRDRVGAVVCEGTTDDAAMGNEQRDGVGKNKRQQTTEYIGGGALQGAIIRVIAGRGEKSRNQRDGGDGGGSRQASPDPRKEG